jgi:hypothetical protein
MNDDFALRFPRLHAAPCSRTLGFAGRAGSALRRTVDAGARSDGDHAADLDDRAGAARSAR